MLTVPVRRSVPALAGALTPTTPLPLPLAPPAIESHAASARAVHEQPLAAVTVKDADPPDAGIDAVVGVTTNVQEGTGFGSTGDPPQPGPTRASAHIAATSGPAGMNGERMTSVASPVQRNAPARPAETDDEEIDTQPVRRYLTLVKTTVSSKGQIVLPAELRQQDRIEPGQEFDVERLDRGDYRLVRRAARPNDGAVNWLLACPEKGFFVPIDSESTDAL